MWPFAWGLDGTEVDVLEIATADRMLWAIRADLGAGPCKMPDPAAADRARTIFPLVYGRLPRCYRELAAPQPIPDGAVVAIRANGLRDGSGYFLVDGKEVRMLDRDVARPEFANGPTIDPYANIAEPSDANATSDPATNATR